MPTIRDLLEQGRKELLDLSTRNRLLSIPTGSKSALIVEIQDELSDQIFRLLVTEKSALSFLPSRQASSKEQPGSAVQDLLDGPSLPQPEGEVDPSSGQAKRHIDQKLQTGLSSEGLQRRLLQLYRDSQTLIEEQGVNVLYLVLGHLKWFEAEQADKPRYAPLVLIPVELDRRIASERFKIHWREEDIQENLSLAEKLKVEFGITLPAFPDEENLNPTAYFDAVAQAISHAKGWEVIPNAITLGFFSFAKFLMYRDLNSTNWPKEKSILEHPLVAGLLQDGFPNDESLFPEDADLDELIPVSRLDHVVDADSSQTTAIEMVRQGKNLVIQGPPGTGKSQSIANIIAAAVLDGKKVLFVAEKLAALEVVKRRLEREGLGPICLELHSHKSSKRMVIEEIGRTWGLGRPVPTSLETIIEKLERHRAHLNSHVKMLHQPLLPSGLTPYRILGKLALLGQRGKDASSLHFDGAERWATEDGLERRRLIGELQERIDQIGLPIRHSWRGVCRTTILSVDFPLIAERIKSFQGELEQLQVRSAQLAAATSQAPASRIADVAQQQAIAGYIARAPEVDKEALSNSLWKAGLESLQALVSEGQRLSELAQRFGERVASMIWEKDYRDARAQIAVYGKSPLRLLNSKYRQAITEVKETLAKELPRKYTDRVALLDQVLGGQKAYRAVQEGNPMGRAAFGVLWRGEKSDWNQLQAILDWVDAQRVVGLDAAVRQLLPSIKEQEAVGKLAGEVGACLVSTREAVSLLWNELKLDCTTAFGQATLDAVPLQALQERCKVWLDQMEEITRWNTYYLRARKARDLALGPLVDRLEQGTIAAEVALDAFDRVYCTQLLREAVSQNRNLGQFDGMSHNNMIAQFRQLDKERLTLAKYRVLVSHQKGIPVSSGFGPAGIVRGEMERKRGHRPVRRLLKDAGAVVQAIKPVFMMSPLSVAQFLEPGAIEFDLLVIDEASQVQPVDALGAVARCKQMVVVGDSKQLPPTRFFMQLTGDLHEAEFEDEDPHAVRSQDVESILGLCCARGIPQKMLRWHYRSRHHTLIAVSNHEFYEDQLFIVPSPYSAATGLGLKFTYVPAGVFDAGKSGTNQIEAQAVCRAVMEHAKNAPELSLGVAAFSVRQRQAIQDELELLRRKTPHLETFFSRQSIEPFFVKNLENVQGDERDVIFISIGYGRNAQGYMAMRFGPLSNEGGERRLNVLISRAKKCCEVFSSITADDIDLERASGRGVAALKTFLTFAETGRLGTSQCSGLDEQSPLEESVRRAVESLGYEVHAQVGIAGFFVDLAVVDRERKGRYVLGIECDGAAYHSSRSARERDRLRQAVLEDHGWILHRVWSTDWFQRPDEQLRKIVEAIERAKKTVDEVTPYEAVPENTVQTTNFTIDREAPAELDGDLDGLSKPYAEAHFAVPVEEPLHELPTKRMADIVLRIVEQEGPIHEDEVAARVRDLWGYGRAGSRVQDAVGTAVQVLLSAKKCKREAGFVSIPDALVVIRNRGNVSSATLRKPDMLPPAEIKAAILALIDANYGARKEEVSVGVARVFGFKSTGSNLKEVVAKHVKQLEREGTIHEINGMLRRSENVNQLPKP